ncbi:MAG: thiolase family protein [Verrucomicrobiales bacterium]
MKSRVAIVAGVRSPFCKAGTELAHLSAADLASMVFRQLLAQVEVSPESIDEVLLGCVAQPAESMNLARIAALRAGVPENVPAVTVHRNCASGFEAVLAACQRIAAGEGHVYLVGGAESMSNIPLFYPKSGAKKFYALNKAKSFPAKLKALTNFRAADFKPQIGLQLGLSDPVSDLNMGQTAEILAREAYISRKQQDAYACQSHQRAIAAQDSLAEELTRIFPALQGGQEAVLCDNGPRSGQSMEALQKLKPVFEKGTGTVTAGNASQVSDGAVGLIVMSEERVEELGLTPLGWVTGYANVGCDPARMGLGPVGAMKQLLASKKRALREVDLFEINEAFAAQILAVLKACESELGSVPHDKLNVNGGAIALGHPVGATGARLILTALKELHRREKRCAVASACVGGGQGTAVMLEAA